MLVAPDSSVSMAEEIELDDADMVCSTSPEPETYYGKFHGYREEFAVSNNFINIRNISCFIASYILDTYFNTNYIFSRYKFLEMKLKI